MKRHRRPLNRSITIGCILFIIALCVLLSFANLLMYKNYVYADYQAYIDNILNYTLSEINGDDLKACIETGEESEQYKKTLLFMDHLMDHFDDIHYFYAILPLNTQKTGNVMSVLSAERYYDRYIDTEGNLYLGWVSDDEFDAAIVAQFFDIMHGDGVVYFEEVTGWGVDYTGAAPIRDGQGNGIAVLAVDIDISFINSMILQYALVNILVITLAGAGFICIFLFWSRKNITKPIRLLEEIAVRFVNHSHGQMSGDAPDGVGTERKTDNEIRALSDAVIKMTEDMRDYVTDIASTEKKAVGLQALDSRDALTGIRNKAAYNNELKREAVKLKDGDTKLGLAIVNLNGLKKINAGYGYDKGDIAIKKLSRLVCLVFDHSPVFRIGGDEFAVILRGGDYDHYSELEARLNAEIGAMARDEALEPWERVSAAIGAAFYDGELDDGTDSLFKRADHAMYDRKREMQTERNG